MEERAQRAGMGIGAATVGGRALAPGIGDRAEGPQLLTRLGMQLKSLYELHVRLQNANQMLRGYPPPPTGSENKAPIDKDPEISLTNIIAAITLVTERCHYEMNEISGLLS